MKIYYATTEAIQRYLVTAEPQYLHQAIAGLSAELRDPELQDTLLTLDNISAAEAEFTIARDGYLRISTTEITNNGHVALDRYIRVVDKVGSGTTAIVLKVAAITDDFLLLVPYTPGGGTNGPED